MTDSLLWHSQCNGGKKCEKHARPVKIASGMQKDLAARKIPNSIHITYMRFKTSNRSSNKFKTFLRP